MVVLVCHRVPERAEWADTASVEIWPSGGVSEALLRPCGCGMAGKPEYAMCMPELLAFIYQGRYTAMAGSGM